MDVRALVSGIVLAIAASCAAGPDSPAPTGGAKATAGIASADWLQNMKQVGEETEWIAQELQRPGGGDLRRVAEAARKTASLVALGYGTMEQKRIPGFASYARDCENWLLQLAMEARHGRSALSRELMAGEATHCKRCHEAAEKTRW